MGIFSKLFPKPTDGEGPPAIDGAESPEAAKPPQAPPPTVPNPQAPPSGARLTASGAVPPRGAPRPGPPVPRASNDPNAPKKAAQPPKPPPLPAAPRSARSPEVEKRDPALIAAGLARDTSSSGAYQAQTQPKPRRSSRRPPPPKPEHTSATSSLASIADTFERLLSGDDVDSGFASLERRKSDRAPALDGTHDTDLSEVRELFAHLAANHVRQVRDFMIDVRWGQATVDWIDVCEPSIRSLRRAAERLVFPELCGALDAFATTLAGAKTCDHTTIEGERRDAILASHATLAALMPQAFALDLDRTQREGVILQSLLAQIPDVRKVTIDKLYAAGVTTLEAMLLATPQDLVSTTGIEPEIAEHIVERFRAYKREVNANAPDPTRARERERIAELAVQLHKLQTEFDRADAEWSKEATTKKRELRQARAQTLNDLNVVLARLGEVELLGELERTSFEQKVVRIEEFLREASQKYEQAGKD